jgi:hypothetical protein
MLDRPLLGILAMALNDWDGGAKRSFFEVFPETESVRTTLSSSLRL